VKECNIIFTAGTIVRHKVWNDDFPHNDDDDDDHKLKFEIPDLTLEEKIVDATNMAIASTTDNAHTVTQQSDATNMVVPSITAHTVTQQSYNTAFTTSEAEATEPPQKRSRHE